MMEARFWKDLINDATAVPRTYEQSEETAYVKSKQWGRLFLTLYVSGA